MRPPFQSLPTPEEDHEPNLEPATARLSMEAASGGDSPEEQRRLSLVDHLLMTAPLVMPSAEFAERVMEALRQHDLQKINRYTAFGLALGLLIAASVVMSVVVGFIMGSVYIVLNWTATYQNLVEGAGMVNGSVGDLLTWMKPLTSGSPLSIAFGLISLPLAWLWLRIMRRRVWEA